MMRFYVSWYPGDPVYPIHDNDCALLISISSVSQDWKIKSFPRLPKYLIVDSGGFRNAVTRQTNISPKKVLERQLKLLADVEVPTIVCSLDAPVLDISLNPGNKDQNLHRTIAYAYEFKKLVEHKNLSKHIIPMGIIQGDTPDAMHYCAWELHQIGFPIYGLGSLALLRNHSKVMERIRAVTDVVPPQKLHIFGVNAIQTVFALKKMGIHSVDSSRPAKAAAYNEVFYSNPFRRFGILGTQSSEMKGRIPKEKRLINPLPCDCPVCTNDPDQILIVGKRENIRLRALHNYYHLKQTFCK